MLAVLDKPEKRNVYPHFAENLRYRRDMSLTAVQQYQIRQRSEILVAVQVALHAAPEHLLHAGVVVYSNHVLDVEPAVARLERSAVAVDYHAADTPGLAEVRHIVAFDDERYLLKIEKVAEILKRVYFLCSSSDPQCEVLAGVVLREHYLRQSVSALRNHEFDSVPRLFPQQLSHKLHIVEFLVDVDLLRDIVAVGIVAQQEIPPHFPGVVLVADEEIFLVDQPSAAVLHRRDTRKADVLRERNYVVILGFIVEYLL